MLEGDSASTTACTQTGIPLRTMPAGDANVILKLFLKFKLIASKGKQYHGGFIVYKLLS